MGRVQATAKARAKEIAPANGSKVPPTSSRHAAVVRSNCPASLARPSPKTAATTSGGDRLQWKDCYETTYGLEPIRHDASGGVTEARCKFCRRFGVEDGKQHQATTLAPLLAPWTRKKSTRTKYFRTFRPDSIVHHLQTTHISKWLQFDRLELDDDARTTFFENLSPSPHPGSLRDAVGIDLPISGGIMRVLHRYLRGRNSVAANQFGSDQGTLDPDVGDGAPDGLNSTTEDFITREGRNFFLRIRDRRQFQTVVESAKDSKSFAGISRLFGVFGRALESMILGTPSCATVAKYVRSVVAINLQAMERVLARSWCFSILVDGGSFGDQKYLDVRLSFPAAGEIRNLHLLAIPVSDRSSSASNYADAVLGVLRNVFGSACLKKLVGVATDGAPTMVGCNAGFGVRVRAAVESEGGCRLVTNWCPSHQLNLAVDRFLSVLDYTFHFRDHLNAVVNMTRTQVFKDESTRECPPYIETRWISIQKSTKFLAEHFESIVKVQKAMRLKEPDNTWWLCLFAVKDVADKTKYCFKRLEFRNVTVGDQYRALGGLVHTLQMQYEQDSTGDAEPSVCLEKVERHIRNTSVYSATLFDALPHLEKTRLSMVFVDAISRFIERVQGIEVEVGRVSTWINLETPKKVIECDDNVFSEAVARYRAPLVAQYGTTAPRRVCYQRRRLIDLFATDDTFRQNVVSRGCRGDEGRRWNIVPDDQHMSMLATFSIGLASISPGTHTVESDFSLIKYMKTNRENLTNYSLEGQLQSRQYTDLLDLVSKVEANNLEMETDAEGTM